MVAKKFINIGIDLTSKLAHLDTGMANSLHKYLQGMEQYMTKHMLVLFVTEANYEKFAVYESKKIQVIKTTPEKVDQQCLHLDGLHLPFNESKTITNCPKIITVYDLIPEHFPEIFPVESITSMRRATSEADFILTISEFSKRDIVEKHGISPQKIHSALIPFFKKDFSDVTTEDVAEKYKLPSTKRLVYPAAGRPHKNHDTLFEALALVEKECHLVLTTGEAHGSERLAQLRALAEKNKISEKVIILGQIPRSDYLALLKSADALVFASKAEGYGIPVVEALALECPVICSKATCLPEIAQDAALYFDPHNYLDIAKKINQFFRSPNIAKELKAMAPKRFAQLSESTLARGLLDGYEAAFAQFNNIRSKFDNSNEVKGLASSAFVLKKNKYNELSSCLYEQLPNQAFIPENSALKTSSIFLKKLSLEDESTPAMFTLLLDCTRLATSSMYSGISRYVLRILQFMNSQNNINVVPFFNRDARGVSKELKACNTFTFSWEDEKFDLIEYRFAESYSRSFGEPIIYHSPYHPLPKKREPDFNYVITICDIFHVTYPHLYNTGFKYITADIIDSIAAKTDEILVISRFTGQDVLSHLGKANITYSPLAPFDKLSNAPAGRRDYVLIPYQHDPRKGFDRMLAVINSIQSSNANQKFIVYGKTKQLDLTKFNDVENNILFYESPSDIELVELYKKSFCFLYLSELEGFGMPPLEAMQYGCSPIILNNSSLAEIYMGWDYLLDNDATTTEIVETIAAIREHDQSKLLEAISKVTDRYSWEICGATHLAGYLRALN